VTVERLEELQKKTLLTTFEIRELFAEIDRAWRAVTDQSTEQRYTYGTRVPRFDLIPIEALTSLANRYEAGEQQYAGKAWNALSKNQEAPADVEFVTRRLTNVIAHVYHALGVLHGVIPDDGDDDAGAIMWGGSLLAVHRARRKECTGSTHPTKTGSKN